MKTGVCAVCGAEVAIHRAGTVAVHDRPQAAVARGRGAGLTRGARGRDRAARMHGMPRGQAYPWTRVVLALLHAGEARCNDRASRLCNGATPAG